MADEVLEVSDLTIDFPSSYGRIGLVRDVTFALRRGECLGLVGESGSGKSLLGLSLIGLQPQPAQLTGSVRLDGNEVLGQSERAWQRYRGSRISMIYQDALVSLNPGKRIAAQLEQGLRGRTSPTPEELLEWVKIRDVSRCLRSYPHQLSGGQRQRVLIGLAISGEPDLIIADEPTTALDVTVQSQVLALLEELRDRLGFGLIFISHDLGLVSTVADRVAVMYAGDLVEIGRTSDVLRAPAHPYTAGLLEASRSLEEARGRLAQIPGTVPVPADFGAACRFVGRCSRAQEDCATSRPLAAASVDGGLVACHHPLRPMVTPTVVAGGRHDG